MRFEKRCLVQGTSALGNIEMVEERKKQGVVEIITNRKAKGHDRFVSEN